MISKKVIIFKQTGTLRFPKTGEWFVGFDGLAHQAHKDLGLEYPVLQPVTEFFLDF